MCHIKALNLLPAVLASTNAELAQCDEAVLIRGGSVTEGSHSNVHIISCGSLITHPLGRHILPGISRGRLLSAARREGIRIIERPFTKNELYRADEVIVTSTTRIAQRAREIDGIPLPLPNTGIGLHLVKSMHAEFITSTA
jgi:D-alanine transaminase